MKWLRHPLVLAGGVVSLLAIPLANWVVLGLGLTLAVAGLFLASLKRDPNALPHPSELSGEVRSALRPIRRLRDEIEELVPRQGALAGLGKEAVVAADDILGAAIRLAEKRTTLAALSRQRAKSEADLAALRGKLEAATSDGERESLQAALEAREQELDHYGTVSRGLDMIDAKLREAEAAMAELRARLGAAQASAALAETDTTDMEAMIDNLKAIGTTLEETESWMEVRS